jgi:hypothetical protein
LVEGLETWLDRVYQVGGERRTLNSLYDEWARDYDQQIWASGNPYIALTAGMVGRHLQNFDAKISDLGYGTDNMAQALHQLGYRNLEGLDLSPAYGKSWINYCCFEAIHFHRKRRTCDTEFSHIAKMT